MGRARISAVLRYAPNEIHGKVGMGLKGVSRKVNWNASRELETERERTLLLVSWTGRA